VAKTTKAWMDSAAARLPRWMGAVAGAGSLVALASRHPRWAAGFAAGSGAAILAYWWLQQVVATALDAGDGRPPRGTMIKFAMRYPLLIILLGVVYLTGSLSIRGVVAGLFVPLAGVLIECLMFVARFASGQETPGGPSGPASLGGPLERPATPPAQVRS